MHIPAVAIIGTVALFASLAKAVSSVEIANQPWLDPSRSSDERLKLFMMQLNITQKYNMLQGDQLVCYIKSY
jgi:hypothetical protein